MDQIVISACYPEPTPPLPPPPPCPPFTPLSFALVTEVAPVASLPTALIVCYCCLVGEEEIKLVKAEVPFGILE